MCMKTNEIALDDLVTYGGKLYWVACLPNGEGGSGLVTLVRDGSGVTIVVPSYLIQKSFLMRTLKK